MKVLKIVGLVLVVLLVTSAPAMAQQPAAASKVPTTVILSGGAFGAGLGMALSIIGAAFGLGKIGSSALEAMARQPEAAPSIQTAMIIVAAMLEGATLASVVLCFVVGLAASF